MSEVIYRPATEADLPTVAAFYTKLDTLLREHTYAFPPVENIGEQWLETFHRTLGRFSMIYVAEYEGKLAGFILTRLKSVPAYLGGVMVGELKDMWVEPEVRRLGTGEKLLRLAIEWLREKKVHSVEAQILMGNEPILRLVQRLGMRPELYQLRMGWEDYQEENQ